MLIILLFFHFTDSHKTGGLGGALELYVVADSFKFTFSINNGVIFSPENSFLM